MCNYGYSNFVNCQMEHFQCFISFILKIKFENPFFPCNETFYLLDIDES